MGWNSDLRETLIVRVSAAAVDGRANEALIAALANSLRIAKGKITMMQGQRSRNKLIQLSIDNDVYQRWLLTVPVVGKE